MMKMMLFVALVTVEMWTAHVNADCEAWTIIQAGVGDKASTAATLEDCRAECIDNDECTGVDWVAAQTTGHQCWLVGPVTKKTTAQSGTDRHTLNRTCLTDCEPWTVQENYGGYGDELTAATTVEDCRNDCSNNDSCTAIDWVTWRKTGRQCWLVGPWTRRSCFRFGVHRHTIDRTCATTSTTTSTTTTSPTTTTQATTSTTTSTTTTTSPTTTTQVGRGTTYSSCKAIRDSNTAVESGEYTIRTVAGNILDKVYCEMNLNGGGYTFINPKDFATLTNEEVQAMFTDKTNFLMRVRRDSDATQPYGVLEQLPQYQSDLLKLGLNEHSDYPAPVNIPFLGRNYMYFGFIPPHKAQTLTQQGLQVNGVNVVFNNCDQNGNSYLALFPNTANQSPTDYAYTVRFPFCIDMFSLMKATGSMMPQEYFEFLETHWGGCGCYAQTDGRESVSGTLAAAIGFR